MPAIEIDTNDRRRVDRLLEFVKAEVSDLPVEARFVLVLKLVKWFDPEIKELRRKAAAGE